jgi:hypothetical protein
MEYLQLFVCKIMSPANMDKFSLSSSNTLYFFLLPIAVAKTYSTMSTKNDESGHHCLIPDQQQVLSKHIKSDDIYNIFS